jgi:hypothetical protein
LPQDGVKLLKAFDGFIEGEYMIGVLLLREFENIENLRSLSSSPFRGVSRAGIIDQDSPHRFRRGAIELSATTPVLSFNVV